MESRILLRASLWRAIENGRSHERRAWSWYEGRRYRVLWRFENGFVSIDGEDGAQHVFPSVLPASNRERKRREALINNSVIIVKIPQECVSWWLHSSF